MKRRNLFGAAVAAVAAATVPAIASASTTDRLEALKSKLAAATLYYEDNMPYDSYAAYFNGVLASQGLYDWVVYTDQTGKAAGHIVDIAVRFDEEVNFVYIPVRFSADYWDRNNRREGLERFRY